MANYPQTTTSQFTGDIVLTNGGKVGIGTTSPGNELVIEASSPRSVLRTSSANYYAVQHVQNSDNDDTEILTYGRSAAGTYFGQTRAGCCFIGSQPNNVFGVGTKNEKDMILATNSTERMRIDSSGKVGIGTTSPTHQLTVYSLADDNTDGIWADLGSSSSKTAITGSTGSGEGVQGACHQSGGMGILGVSYSAGGIGGVFSNGMSSTGTALQTLQGRVSIGAGASPSEKLEVAGSIKASGSVQVANNTDAASASNVGAIRYRTSGNNSYVDICMQNGASSYTWENIAMKSW